MNARRRGANPPPRIRSCRCTITGWERSETWKRPSKWLERGCPGLCSHRELPEKDDKGDSLISCAFSGNGFNSYRRLSTIIDNHGLRPVTSCPEVRPGYRLTVLQSY